MGILFRFYTALQYSPIEYLWSDPARHWQLGTDPLSDDPMSAIDPIMYQWWISLVSRITGSDNLLVGIYAGILSAITPYFWYRFFKEAFESKTIALIGWLILTWLPSWIGIYSYFMNETLFLPLLGIALEKTWQNHKKENTKSWFLMCLTWLLASLTRVIALPLAILSILYNLLTQKNKIKKVFILCLLSLVFVIPLGIRSYKILGVFAPFGFPMLNQIYMQSGKKIFQMDVMGRGFWEYSSPSMYEKHFGDLFEWKSTREGTCLIKIDPNHGMMDWNNELHRTWPGMKVYLRMWFENQIYFFIGSSWTDNNPEHLAEDLSNKMRWIWLPLFLLVMLGNLVSLIRHKKIALLPLITTVGFLLCIFSPTGVMEGRYRKPMEGLLIANLLWFYGKPKATEKNFKFGAITFC
ncbi:MAG: glycosyltransferase family 39 protein [Candidatus Caenarcaniphilales bacterium]|nr:glycosyltransferase family 39 protein [Candidatus Caenarcaniphilales bacterium]